MLRQALAVAFVLTAGMAARAADAGKVEQKPYKSVLILGMFNGPQDAERLKGLHDPKTHQPYDRIFAFGTSLDGKKTFFEITRVAAGEGIRVGMDNFAIRPTDYGQLQGLRTERLTCHSNGNDVGATALRLGIIKGVKEFVALAPPRGFDAKALPVTSVQIFYTRGDRVAEVWGKGTTVFLFGPFRLTDITAPLRTALPAGNTNPKVETVVFDGPGYVTTLPHYFNTVFGNYCTYTRSTPPSPISTAARPTPAPTPVPSPSPSPVPRAPRGNESGVLMQMKLTDKSFQEAKPANNTASIAKDDSAVVPGDRPVAAPASRPAGPNGRPDGNSLWWRPPGEASK